MRAFTLITVFAAMFVAPACKSALSGSSPPDYATAEREGAFVDDFRGILPDASTVDFRQVAEVGEGVAGDLEGVSLAGTTSSRQRFSGRGRSADADDATFHGEQGDVEVYDFESPPAPKPELQAPAAEGVREVSDDDAAPRHLVYRARLVLAVARTAAALDRAEDAPRRFGGWIHRRGESSLELKVPSAELDAAITWLSTIGGVRARELAAADVSEEYTDLHTRIRVLRQTQTQLLALLDKATTVEETLKVRAALGEVTEELELAVGRLKKLEHAIAYATLRVEFVPFGSYANSEDPFPWVDRLGVESTAWE